MQIDPERKGEKGIEDNIRSHKLNPYYREASYVTFPATLSNHQVCSQSKGEKKRTVKPFSRHYTEQNSTHSSKDSWLTDCCCCFVATTLECFNRCRCCCCCSSSRGRRGGESSRKSTREALFTNSLAISSRWGCEGETREKNNFGASQPASQPLLRGKQGVSGADFSLHFRVQPQPRGFRVLSAFPSTAPPSLFPGRRRRASFFHD